MKIKISALILALLLLLSFSCCTAEGEQDTTVPSESLEAPTEAAVPSMSEMSPQTVDTALPFEVGRVFSELDLTGIRRIEDDAAVLKTGDTDKICRLNNTEYYYLMDGKVLVAYLNAEELVEYSAYYDENGHLFYFGNNEFSWYFNGDGDIFCVIKTYTIEANGNEVVSFYNEKGERQYIRSGEVYYDNNFDELSDEKTLEVIKYYGSTAEVNS